MMNRSFSCGILALFVVPLCGHAQRLHFGTNVVTPGKVIEFTAPLNARALTEISRLRLFGANARCAWVAPEGLTNLSRPCPLLIASVPSGGSAIDWMRSITNRAFKEGWAVLAAEGPKVSVNDDTIQFGWGMLSSVMDQFTRTWPQTKQWPVACVGFSGGAKRSAAVAAAMSHDGWRVIGVFLGGCNEDRATLGLQLFQPGQHFKQVPFFLSNGSSDPIANAQHAAAVAESMRRSGFQSIRLESYAGGHRQNNDHLSDALRWFQQLGDARSVSR